MENSYFDGRLLQKIGYQLLGLIISIVTFGICLPWSVCIIKNWEVKHTVINGKRLVFDGTAMKLFGNWIKWLLLTIVTIGIYGLWVSIKMKNWIVSHTHFEN